MSKVSRYKKGLTLLEVVLSFTILMIIIVPCISMVISSVKSNENASNKLQAGVIAQKYIEQIKAANTIGPIGTSTYTEDGFDITEVINAVNDYSFPTGNGQSSQSISYDMRIVIDSGNRLTVYDKDNIAAHVDNLVGASNITIGNNTSSLDYKLSNGGATNTTVTKSGSSGESGNVKVELNGSYDININAVNNSQTGTLTFYFVKQVNSQNEKYTLSNIGGVVKSYSNILSNNNTFTNTSRVYRVDLTVAKKGVVLQKITTYKTFYE